MDGAVSPWPEVKRLYPETVRIVLSGQTAAEAATRALPVAHQFLSKPIGSGRDRRVSTADGRHEGRSAGRRGAGGAGRVGRAHRHARSAKSLRRPSRIGAGRPHALNGDRSVTRRSRWKLLQTVNLASSGLRAQMATSERRDCLHLGVDLVEVGRVCVWR